MDKGLVTKIKDHARTLGFSRIGITRPDVSKWKAPYISWIKKGYHGEMEYMERTLHARLDPENLLPRVKSVIVTFTSYFPGLEYRGGLNRPDRGYISIYARGMDYHYVIREKLTGLLQFIQGTVSGPVEGRIFVDSGPVLEKPLAMEAGIGWMGKNSIIITEYGSWGFLGVILLDIEITPDEPVENRCGDCTACMDACPTGAIVEPWVVDSRRCIPYLLGELKGPIPPDLRPLIGNRIFGCDDCQWACPWNRMAPVTEEDAFKPRKELTDPPLMELLQIKNNRSFKEFFKNTPVERIRRKRFLRNVIVASGNSCSRDILDILEDLVSHEDPIISEHAEWAIRNICR